MRRTLILLGAALAAAVVAGAARASTIEPQVSSNWSGYAIVSPDDPTATPLSFSDVTGTWVQPKAKCSTTKATSAAFWVGIGGYDESSSSLEQLGTGVDCDGATATPTYYAWWELVPASSVRIKLKIFPGDTINAAVLVSGETITFSLKDQTRGTRFSKVLTTSQALDTGSAEWIAEAPSECGSFGHCKVIPLTNFGTVTFTKSAAIANTHPGTLTDGLWSTSPIELVTGGETSRFFGQVTDDDAGTGAVPGDVTADGRGFSVSYAQNLTPLG